MTHYHIKTYIKYRYSMSLPPEQYNRWRGYGHFYGRLWLVFHIVPGFTFLHYPQFHIASLHSQSRLDNLWGFGILMSMINTVYLLMFVPNVFESLNNVNSQNTAFYGRVSSTAISFTLEISISLKNVRGYHVVERGTLYCKP